MSTEPSGILIEGPTIYGRFFIRDKQMNVWDGSMWRGFGAPAEYMTFREAFRVATHLTPNPTQPNYDCE